MLLGLHRLLLSAVISVVDEYTYRVSQLKEKITRLFS
jgi:hypothetical protein